MSQLTFNEEAPCFTNIEAQHLVKAVEIVCTYLQKPFFYRCYDSKITTISINEYIDAAYARKKNLLKRTETGDFDSKSICLLGIKLAHGISVMQAEELSSAVFDQAIRIAMFVKDYQRLDVLLHDKYLYKKQNGKLFLAVQEKYEMILFQTMQYAKYGHFQGLKNLLRLFGEQKWFIENLKKILAKAAQNGHIEIVSFLLKCKEEVFLESGLEEAFYGTTDREIVQLLLGKNGKKISEAEMAAVFQSNLNNEEQETSRYLPVFSCLLDFKLSDHTLDSIFLSIIGARSNDVMEIFIQKKIEYVLAGAEKFLPMFVKNRQLEGVELLFAYGNISVKSEIKALFKAVCLDGEDIEMVQFLLMKKPKILSAIPPETMIKLLEKALSRNHTYIAHYLIEKKLEISSGVEAVAFFYETAKRGNVRIADILLSQRPEFSEEIPLGVIMELLFGSMQTDNISNMFNNIGISTEIIEDSFFKCVKHNHIHILKFLLQKRADIPSDAMRTVLREIMSEGHIEVLEVLLEEREIFAQEISLDFIIELFSEAKRKEENAQFVEQISVIEVFAKAAQNGYKYIVHFLIGRKPEILKEIHQNTITEMFSKAAYNNDTVITKLLLIQRPDIPFETIVKVLFATIKEDRKGILALLLIHRKDISLPILTETLSNAIQYNPVQSAQIFLLGTAGERLSHILNSSLIYHNYALVTFLLNLLSKEQLDKTLICAYSFEYEAVVHILQQTAYKLWLNQTYPMPVLFHTAPIYLQSRNRHTDVTDQYRNNNTVPVYTSNQDFRYKPY